MASYTEISQNDFDLFMRANLFQCVNKDTRGELVYTRKFNDGNYIIKVFSSIVPDHGGRDSGEDAIRVVMLVKDKPVWKGARVHRVDGWRKNLRSRIEEALRRGFFNESWQCRLCGSPMVLRDGQYGPFAGCTVYECKYTRKVE